MDIKTMTYIGKVEKAMIVNAVKPIFKKWGVKGTFAVMDGVKICLTLKSGKIDFIGNYILTAATKPTSTLPDAQAERLRASGELSVNCYWIEHIFSGDAREFLLEVLNIIKLAPYMELAVGDHHKPYMLI